MQPKADEPLPAIIEEVLNPTPGYWLPAREEESDAARQAEVAKEKDAEKRAARLRDEQPLAPVEKESTNAEPPSITAEDVDAVLEHGGLQALVGEGFDADELQELADVDPLEQDLSDDPLVMLQLATLG
ncbi:MAG: hypothetical protein E6Q97_20470 [Desulfurellales bacterium]|nr:MAG: hypothetical protein E6Q97_20470 [Desulfurellales bacterium]